MYVAKAIDMPVSPSPKVYATKPPVIHLCMDRRPNKRKKAERSILKGKIIYNVDSLDCIDKYLWRMAPLTQLSVDGTDIIRQSDREGEKEKSSLPVLGYSTKYLYHLDSELVLKVCEEFIGVQSRCVAV